MERMYPDFSSKPFNPTVMIQTINEFEPPQNASPYNPAKTVTVPANDEAEITLKGRSANAFGFNRILPWCADMDAIEIKAELNEDRTIFKPVQLSVVRELFHNHSLLAPYIIKKHNDLRFTLTNPTGTDIDVNIQVLGYDAPALQKLVNDYKAAGLKMPRPAFLYGKGEVPANSSNHPIEVPTKSKDVDLIKAAIKSGSDKDIRVSLEVYNETIKNRVFIQQLNDEYEAGRSMVPIPVGRNVPFTVKASNTNANPQTLSFLGEAYVHKD
jgi:hypothetical protein